jgi:hypothetical protein
MTWTVPEPQRVREPIVADKRTTLDEFPDKQRTP